MNYSRIALAAIGGTVAYFLTGFLFFALLPSLRSEFAQYPAVYRGQEDIKRVMPAGMLAMFISIAALAVIYALLYRGGLRIAEGARFGALIGVFSVGAFVFHKYVNLNIGLKLTLQQATVYFIEWTIVGAVIGLLYKPAAP